MKTKIRIHKNAKTMSKARLFLIAATILVSISSCSRAIEKLIPQEEDVEAIMVEGSPWVFLRYENSFVEDDGESGLSGQEITDDMNDYLVGVSFTFNADGTGSIDIPEQGEQEWVWTLSTDRLTTVSSNQTDEYTFFSAEQNLMSFESRTSTLHTKDSEEYIVAHVGKYFFK